MIQNFRNRNPVWRIHDKHSIYEILTILWDQNWKFILCCFNKFEKIIHVFGFIRDCPLNHSVEYNSKGPDICTKTWVSVISDDFRSNISRSTTLFFDKLRLLDNFAHSEIAEFHSGFIIKKNIIKLNISM